MIYSMRWKEKVTPRGRRYFQLVASGRRTSVSDCGLPAGWPSSTVGNAQGSQMAKDASPTGKRPDGSKATVSLNQVATFAGWPTPAANTYGENLEREMERRKRLKEKHGNGNGSGLTTTVAAQMAAVGTEELGPARITANGTILTGSYAGMESGGQLNPALSRWLMGYPVAWCQAAIRAARNMSTRRRKPA
jgi:hypothetical protein